MANKLQEPGSSIVRNMPVVFTIFISVKKIKTVLQIIQLRVFQGV